MCDTLVALQETTINRNTIFAKSADCEVNEANVVVRIPRKNHNKGEKVRITHLTIPQSCETYEVILAKAFWTYGCEMGINEHGLVMGEEAVYTTQEGIEQKDGIIGPDLMRIGLERANNCQEAIETMIKLLEEYGQGGNCEMSGNSHFDSSFLMADSNEAYLFETAGRNWALRKIDNLGSISNFLLIEDDWDNCSRASEGVKINWKQEYALPDVPLKLGAYQRQSITYDHLAKRKGNISVKSIFDILRHHGSGYHPAVADAHYNICVHAGPQNNRWWQADNAMVSEIGDHGAIIWITGTSGNCISIFKPIFLGIDLPNCGHIPSHIFDPETLWWKHELLHRRAMADFDKLVPEIRKDFDIIEAGFLSAAETVKKGRIKEKKEFSDYCFRKAMQATEIWIERLRIKKGLTFSNSDYRNMWIRLNSEAGIKGMLS